MPPLQETLVPEELTVSAVDMETVTEAVPVQPAPAVTVTVYVPVFTDCAFEMEGVALLDVKAFGPDHA
jgi:hypothetical protein